ncbi:MAG TPA: DUF4446 family protein [Candidatus Krumholzibacteria bacterium]
MDQTVFIGAVVLTALALVGLVVGLMAFFRVRAISGRFSWASGKDAGSIDTLPALLRAVESNQRDIGVLKTAFDESLVEARTHFKYMGIVRYNAFDGVAGQQSYSLCILDENKTGILISNLVGTTFARGYAVEIKAGEPSRPLGEEETAALVAAMKNGKS